jgi:hypothetical protein
VEYLDAVQHLLHETESKDELRSIDFFLQNRNEVSVDEMENVGKSAKTIVAGE